jgi:hypothetical protein
VKIFFKDLNLHIVEDIPKYNLHGILGKYIDSVII